MLVPTAEVLAVGHNTQLIVAQGGCVLLSGERGVGKSLQLLHALYRRKHEEEEPGRSFVGAAMRARGGGGAAAALQRCVEGAR